MANHLASQPRFSHDLIIEFIRDAYGLTGELEPLASERDQNFRLTVNRNSNDSQAESWVLKICNSNQSRPHLELENEVIDYLGGSPLGNIIPQLFKNSDGHSIFPLVHNGEQHLTRMVGYRSGRVMAKVKPCSKELLADLGTQLGILSKELSSFRGGFETNDLRKDFHWNLDRFEATFEEHRNAVLDLTLLDSYLNRYRSRVIPMLSCLRKSLIHNDANDHNLIVSPPAVWPQKLTGLIDFGDMAFGSTINELAIAIAYVMLDKPDPLRDAGIVIQNYHRQFALESSEIDILFDLACARLCTSVLMAAYQRELNPNNEYLSVTDLPAQETLKKLREIHSDFASTYFRQACDQTEDLASNSLSRFFSSNRADFYPLLGQELDEANSHVFDLSVHSLEPWAGDLGSGTPDQLFAELKRLGKSVGIGRYREPRTCYQGEQFEEPTESPTALGSPDPRTIHMGIDLFVDAGTAVHTPWPGKIHSFADNDIPFDYGPTIIVEHITDENEKFFTLYGHLSRQSLTGLTNGQIVDAGQKIAEIGEQSENGGWAPHLHFQVMSNDLGMHGNYPGVVRASELPVWEHVILDPYDLARIPRELLPTPPKTASEIRVARNKFLNPSLSLSYSQPLHIVRGNRQYLFDSDGLRYLDGVNNVCHVGHCHSHVTRAAANQLNVLNTNTRYLHENITRYAERLAKMFPDPLEVCFFVNSGSEANDLALRLARNFTQRQEIICVDGAYHGNLASLIDISPYKYKSEGGSGKPVFTHEIPQPDSYRGIHLEQNPDTSLGEFYSRFVLEAVKTSAEANRGTGHSGSRANHENHRIAAFICESILSCGGQIVLPENYLLNAYKFCRREKILCIADEVQVGMGRIGDHFWGFESQGVIPDIVTLGKPIGNGFPLGAVVTTRAIAEAFDNGMEYFNTFGGNPVSCAVGNAVLDVMESENLQRHAKTIGKDFLAQLNRLKQEFPVIGDVRGLGLFLGIEFIDPASSRLNTQSSNYQPSIDQPSNNQPAIQPCASVAKYVVERMKQNGVLLSTDGPDHNVIKIKPPICFTRDNVDQVIRGLRLVLLEDFPQSMMQK